MLISVTHALSHHRWCFHPWWPLRFLWWSDGTRFPSGNG